jgi:GAF domain-containing protein
MKAKLLQLITPPQFADEEKTRVSRLLNNVLLAGIAGTLIAGAFFPLTRNLLWAVLILLAVELTCLALMHSGRLQTACLLFTFSSWIVFILLVYIQGGVTSSTALLPVLVILWAGLLMGERYAALFTALNIIAYAALLYLGAAGRLPPPMNPNTPLPRLLITAIAFSLVAVMQSLAQRGVHDALHRARQAARELIRANADLQTVRASLERRVRERTSTLERRAAQLEAAAELGRSAASLRNLDVLLEQVTRLISQRFGFYHVAVFLLDANGESALLRAASSQGGKIMIQRGYRVEIGDPGMVGTVLHTRRPALVADVQADAVYIQQEALPTTRSALALPLLAGGVLLGVLDMQSETASAFTQDELPVLRLLADPISTAIENSRLFEQYQLALEASRRAYGSLTQTAWEKLLKARLAGGYLARADVLRAVEGDWPAEMLQAGEQSQTLVEGETLAIPIQVREQTLGVVRLAKDDHQAWNEQEIAFMKTLTDQLGQALESARLYSETQRRAERERLTAEITARMRTSNDPQAILQTAIQELRQALGVRQAQVLIRPAGTEAQPKKDPENRLQDATGQEVGPS